MKFGKNFLSLRGEWSRIWRRNISQQRIILVPQIPKDTPESNPILKTDRLTEYDSVAERDCYFGLGKALLEFESCVSQVEKMCSEGNRDFKSLLNIIEKPKVHFESVWNNVNMLLMTTDQLNRDQFGKLHQRAEKALQTRYDSRDIYEAFKEISLKSEDMLEEEQQILERYLAEFKYQGFDLPEKKHVNFREIFIPNLTLNLADYNYKMQRSTNRFQHSVVDPNVVREFPIDVLRAISVDSSQPSKGPWTITLHPYIYSKFLEYCPDRRLRWNAYMANVNRGSKDFDIYLAVTTNVKNILKNRRDIAVTLGYRSFSDMTLESKMANEVKNVETMVSCLLPSAKAGQENELENLQEFASKNGFEEDLTHYDISYFKRKQRRAMIGGLTDDDLRNYFPLPKVLDTIFSLCENMYSIRIEHKGGEDALAKLGTKAWNKDVQFYRVIDQDGTSVLGQFYFDPYIRDDKIYSGTDKGFYFPLHTRSGATKSIPLGSMVMSLPCPSYGKPSLLNFFEVEEVFRTVGRMLGHILNESQWSDLSTQYLEEDCLEVVPEYMTHWLYVPEILASLCNHWSTGESPAQSVLEGLANTRKHMAGLELCEELYKSSFDTTLYTEDTTKESYVDISSRLYPDYLLIPKEKEDNFPLYSEDIIARKHPGSYYSKTWSKMIAADAFYSLHEIGMENSASIRETSKRFRECFLANGSFLPSAEKFRRFRGRDPSHEALLLFLGLKESKKPKQRSSGQSSQ